MTPEEAQLIFYSCAEVVIICYVLGMGMGLVIKLIKSAF